MLIDLSGDGVADFVDGAHIQLGRATNGSFDVSMSDTTGGLDAKTLNFSTDNLLSITPGDPYLVLGDWLRTGQPNWLSITGPTQGKLYSVTANSAGSFALPSHGTVRFPQNCPALMNIVDLARRRTP